LHYGPTTELSLLPPLHALLLPTLLMLMLTTKQAGQPRERDGTMAAIDAQRAAAEMTTSSRVCMVIEFSKAALCCMHVCSEPFFAAPLRPRQSPSFRPALVKACSCEVATRARQPGMAEEILRYTTARV
jgi:hypothetical protein